MSQFSDVKRGTQWQDEIGNVRVMAVADKWVMCRRGHGCTPFTVYVKDFILAYTKVTPAPPTAAEPQK